MKKDKDCLYIFFENHKRKGFVNKYFGNGVRNHAQKIRKKCRTKIKTINHIGFLFYDNEWKVAELNYFMCGKRNLHHPILSDQVFLVTGGTSGIGKEAVRKFSILGANVIFTGRKIKEAEKVISSIKSEENYVKVEFFKADLEILEDIKSLYMHIKNKYGKLNVLINNAGNSGSYPKRTTVYGFESIL